LTRVAVILHERLGNWFRQLRPRLYNHPVRWLQTRSRADLEEILSGLACPIVLIDLGRHAVVGLKDLDSVLRRAPDARVLVLDPHQQREVPELARELGATHVISGFVPPPIIAELLARWIALAQLGRERAGWSRTTFPETETDPWSWLSDYLSEPATSTRIQPVPSHGIVPSCRQPAGRNRGNGTD
jgi:hypothetical protein